MSVTRHDLFTSGREGYHTYRIPALAVSTHGTVLAFCEARRNSGRDDDEIDITLRRSLDSGQTWEPRRIAVSDGSRTCGNPCPVVDGHTGTILLPFCKDNQQVFLTWSEDEGQT
jgi:sialidase-1